MKLFFKKSLSESFESYLLLFYDMNKIPRFLIRDSDHSIQDK